VTEEKITLLSEKEAANLINKVLNVGYSSASNSVAELDAEGLDALSRSLTPNEVKIVLYENTARKIRDAKNAAKQKVAKEIAAAEKLTAAEEIKNKKESKK